MTASRGDSDRTASTAVRLVRFPYISAPQVGVGAGQPVFARRTEDVHVERVLERQSAVRHMRGNDDDLTRPRSDLPLAIRTEPEVQRALEYVGELLVVVRVLRDIVTFLQVHMRNHHAFAGNEAPGDRALEWLLWDLVPAMMCNAVKVRSAHSVMPSIMRE